MINKTGKFFVLPIIFSLILSGIIFAAEGDVIWTKTHNGPGCDDHAGNGITVDAIGNVYATGFEEAGGQRYNIWVRKYQGAFGEHFRPVRKGK